MTIYNTINTNSILSTIANNGGVATNFRYCPSLEFEFLHKHFSKKITFLFISAF